LNRVVVGRGIELQAITIRPRIPREIISHERAERGVYTIRAPLQIPGAIIPRNRNVGYRAQVDAVQGIPAAVICDQGIVIAIQPNVNSRAEIIRAIIVAQRVPEAIRLEDDPLGRGSGARVRRDRVVTASRINVDPGVTP